MVDHRSIEAFLYLEARLADEHAYAEWEALWADDALYWVPAAADGDPMTVMSVIHDNRHRISTRIKQLETGRRLAQAPASRLRRQITNIEILDDAWSATETPGDDTPAGGEVEVQANFVVHEAREAGNRQWAGRVTYRLRPTAGASDPTQDPPWQLFYKKVDLVDRPWTLPTLAFLI